MSEQPIQNERAPWALPGMICGIVGVVTCWLAVSGLILGIIAIVFFVKANHAIKQSDGKLEGKGMAIAGLVCGIVATVFGFFYAIYYAFAGFLVGSIFSSGALFK
jgi:hypothetical protein